MDERDIGQSDKYARDMQNKKSWVESMRGRLVIGPVFEYDKCEGCVRSMDGLEIQREIDDNDGEWRLYVCSDSLFLGLEANNRRGSSWRVGRLWCMCPTVW
jgi:hypothetical protein